MIAPPRFVEALLSSVGAATEYRDAILGDLTEEFRSRAVRDGDAAARRWYYREAMCAAPHLLRHGIARMTRADARRVGGSIITGMVGMWVLSLVYGLALVAVLRLIGAALPPRGPSGYSVAITVIAFVHGVAGTVLGGYFAAWMDDETPMLSALAFALVWTVVDTVVLIIEPHFAWQFIAPPMILLGATLGGALRTSRARRTMTTM